MHGHSMERPGDSKAIWSVNLKKNGMGISINNRCPCNITHVKVSVAKSHIIFGLCESTEVDIVEYVLMLCVFVLDVGRLNCKKTQHCLVLFRLLETYLPVYV